MRALLLMAVMAGGCGTARPRPPPAQAARVPDAIPERISAQRHNDPHMQAEGEEERWGMEQKRQRDLEKRRKAAAQQQPGSTGPAKSGADVTKQTEPSGQNTSPTSSSPPPR
jgi:hypothetical protein